MNIPWPSRRRRTQNPSLDSVPVQATASSRPQELTDESLSIRDRVDLARWHIDRYDRLRASTSSRAAVVLSAGAILSAGNAVILSQLLQQSASSRLWLIAVCTFGLTASAALIVLSVIRATGVLVSLRLTRDMFPDPDLPPGLVFNATDTVRHAPTFRQFQDAVWSQDLAHILEAANVELWIIIRQHRHRYARLRSAVRALRFAATAFLAVLTVLVISNLILQSV
jgi:hypothetical protein